jgi:cobalt/nickel transport system permease protein
MIILSSTTKFTMFLKGLECLKVPKVLIMILSFMYRYIFVLIDEAERLERAINMRYFGGYYLRQIKIFANIIGLLFIRAYERGERVYQSMVARGFDGKVRTLNTLKLRMTDILFSIVFLGILIIIKIWEM